MAGLTITLIGGTDRGDCAVVGPGAAGLSGGGAGVDVAVHDQLHVSDDGARDDPLVPRAIFGVLNTLLFFPSGAIYPTEGFPVWLRWISVVDPFTYAVHALKNLLLKNTGIPGDLLRRFGSVRVFGAVDQRLASCCSSVKSDTVRESACRDLARCQRRTKVAAAALRRQRPSRWSFFVWFGLWYGWFLFFFEPERHTVEHFMNAVVAGDLPLAYQIWKPHGTSYSFQEFTADWGATGLLQPAEELSDRDGGAAEGRQRRDRGR